MRFWLFALSWRTFCRRTFAIALAVALSLATLCQSQAADPEPKRVLMLHSFGLRFKPWTIMRELPVRKLPDNRNRLSIFRTILL